MADALAQTAAAAEQSQEHSVGTLHAGSEGEEGGKASFSATSSTSSTTTTSSSGGSTADDSDNDHDEDDFQDVRIDENSDDISPKTQVVALPEQSLTDEPGTPLATKHSSLHGAQAALAPAPAAATVPGTSLSSGATPRASIIQEKDTPAANAQSRLSVDADQGTGPARDLASSSPAAAAKRSFWGILRSAAPSPAATSSAADKRDSTPADLPRPSLTSNPVMAVSAAPAINVADGRNSFASTHSGRNSLAPSLFAQPTSPASPSGSVFSSVTAPASLQPSNVPEPASTSRKTASAFSPFASIMSNLRTRTSNATSASSTSNADDPDGRSRLPRRDLDEEKLAEDVMRFAEARHVLRTENDVEELRLLGLRLEEAWRDKLGELNILRAKLESAQDTVSDLEDENGNLRVQLGLLSEQVAARETDLEDFQRLTIGQIEAQRALWEEESREERENLQFTIAQAKREALEQKSINAQLRLVILGTLQGRLDGLSDWLSKQDEDGSKRTSKRLSAQIASRRESLKSRMLRMDSLARCVGEEGGDQVSTPSLRQQEGVEGSSDAVGPGSSVMDEVSSTTSGKAPGGSSESSEDDEEADTKAGSGASSGKQRARKATEDGVEEGDDLFDIEDVLFNLPMSPQSVPGRPATLLFNEPLNVDQLRKMGFFREQLNSSTSSTTDFSPGTDADLLNSGANGIGVTGLESLLLSPSASFDKPRGLPQRSATTTALLSPTSPNGGTSLSSSTSSASTAATSPQQQQQTQRLLMVVEKLQADQKLAEAARLENVMLLKRYEDEARRANELEEELEQTKIRLEQTEAAVADLFGAEGEGGAEEGEDEGEVAGSGGDQLGPGSSFGGAKEAPGSQAVRTSVGARAAGQHALGASA
ncbi:hypothetical protein V8E36_008610 [Tilletia maclaganii]